MDYNLAHALFGRFGVLIPLLGFFFELAGIITRKKLVSNIAGGIVIFGSFLVLMAGATGLIELKNMLLFHENMNIFHLHYIVGGILTVSFLIVSIIRSILFKKESEPLSVFY
ncbi:MAG: hypothetical protein D6831_02375, partial [Aquificota bacterium]